MHKLYDRASGKELSEGDETTLDGHGHYAISRIDGNRKMLFVFSERSGNPLMVGASRINAEWRAIAE